MQTTLSSAFYRPISYSARYTFSGKERDEESGFSYFGARYYNSTYSIWLSVDPMSDKYPSISPYAYCANNPVKLVDPNGDAVKIWYGNNKSITYTPGMKVKKRYDSFVKDAITGLNFLYDHPQGDNNRIAYLANEIDLVLTIYQQQEGVSSRYSGEKRELKWDNHTIDVFEEGSQSPIIGLAHEIDHADRSFHAWDSYYSCQTDCDKYVDQMYSRDAEAAEKSAIQYENFIGNQMYEGKPISTYKRTEYVAPVKLVPAKTIFSIVE